VARNGLKLCSNLHPLDVPRSNTLTKAFALNDHTPDARDRERDFSGSQHDFILDGKPLRDHNCKMRMGNIVSRGRKSSNFCLVANPAAMAEVVRASRTWIRCAAMQPSVCALIQVV
jgi:hypothetical protein